MTNAALLTERRSRSADMTWYDLGCYQDVKHKQMKKEWRKIPLTCLHCQRLSHFVHRCSRSLLDRFRIKYGNDQTNKQTLDRQTNKHMNTQTDHLPSSSATFSVNVTFSSLTCLISASTSSIRLRAKSRSSSTIFKLSCKTQRIKVNLIHFSLIVRLLWQRFNSYSLWMFVVILHPGHISVWKR